MDARDWFVGLGYRAELNIAGLTSDTAALEQRTELYERIEAHFEALSKDGSIDAKGVSEVLNELRSAGLDTSELQSLYQQLKGGDSSLRDAGESLFASHLSAALSGAEAHAQDQIVDNNQKVEQQQVDVDLGYGTASAYDKKLDETYRGIIQNLTA
jgi:hypothetical protein